MVMTNISNDSWYRMATSSIVTTLNDAHDDIWQVSPPGDNRDNQHDSWMMGFRGMVTGSRDINASSSSSSSSVSIGVCSSAAAASSDFCHFKVMVDVYAVLCLCVLGIAANVLSIVILGRDQTVRSTTRYLLQMLAVSDALYLLACLGYQTAATLEECTVWGFATLNGPWAYAKSSVYTWASVTQTVTVWTVVIVTADRWVAITRPLQAPRYSTMPHARRAVVAAWILALVYNAPRLFERYVDEVNDVATVTMGLDNSSDVIDSSRENDTTVVAATTSAVVVTSCKVTRWTWLRTDTVYVIVYDSALFFLLRFLLPLSSLAFFNTRLLQAIRTSNNIKKAAPSFSSAAGRSSRGPSRLRDYSLTVTSMSGPTTGCDNTASCYDCVTRGRESAASRQKVRHTQMLVVVVIVFFICELPDFLLRVYLSVYAVLRTFDASYEKHYFTYQRPVLRYANVASNFLLTINSCCNFVIYILIGRKFRAILVYMLLGRRRSSSVAEAHF